MQMEPLRLVGFREAVLRAANEEERGDGLVRDQSVSSHSQGSAANTETQADPRDRYI